MNRNLLTLLIVAVISISLVVFNAGCTNKEKESEPHASMAKTKQMEQSYQGKVDENGKASGATMGSIFTAENLYTCSMHPQVVTDNAKARCPLCGMNLTMMDADDKTALLGSHPKGCVMDPIVVPGDSDAEKCAMCKMNLEKITGEDHSGHNH